MTRLRCLLAAIALLLVPSRVAASEPLLVSPTQREGEIDNAIQTRLDERLLDALRKSEVEPVELAATHAAALAGCSDDACRAEQLAARGSRFWLVPHVAVADRDYRMTLTLYGETGQQLARVQETCSLCGAAEAEDLLAELAARVARKVELAAQASTLRRPPRCSSRPSPSARASTSATRGSARRPSSCRSTPAATRSKSSSTAISRSGSASTPSPASA